MMRIGSVVLMVSGLLLAACNLVAPGSPAPGAQPNAQNGERIYFTSVSGRGDPITYTGGPNFGGMMMGSYLTCAACHGPEGRGGLHLMHMTTMNAPDIRYSTLSTMPEMQKSAKPYGLDDFKLEVENGRNPAGTALEADMPRWSMSDADLQDLFAFIKSLQ